MDRPRGALPPLPADEDLHAELDPWARGKGTLWFGLDTELPTALLERAVAPLTGAAECELVIESEPSANL